MTMLDLVFVVHDHQPVGNFEHVLEDVHRRSYKPFLAALERHPGIKCVLHQSGILWEWMESRHPEHLEGVDALVQRGQIELLGGPYYEALLPAIAADDRRGQIDKLGAWLEHRFGVRPRGAWIPERVWEPQLVSSLVDAGIEYTLLDDSQFEAAGIEAHRLDGPFLVNDAGVAVRVFPMRQRLRYLLPFASVEDAVTDLHDFAMDPRRGVAPLVVCGDDGEKFGVWPGTYARCWEEGWLDRFFDQVTSASTWMRSVTLADGADRTPVRGRAALPVGAYPEFMEWSLPPEIQPALPAARSFIAAQWGATAAARCVRGGSWREFLERYPEAQWLYQRVQRTSRMIAARTSRDSATSSALQRARDEVWKAECNCASWHGLFGGIYLPHLRGAVRAALLRAERLLSNEADDLPVQVLDVDADGRPEIVLRSRELQAFIKPDSGGAVFELDDRLRCFDLLDVVARRPETYHESPGSGAYDSRRLGACVDRLLPESATLLTWADPSCTDLAALTTQPYEWTLGEGGVRLECSAPLALPGAPVLRVVKTLRLEGAGFEARYELDSTAEHPTTVCFGIEMVVNFLAGDAPDRYFDVPGVALESRHLRSAGVVEGVRRFDVVDEWLGLRARYETDVATQVWRTPVETRTRAATGEETIYQGSLLLFAARVSLGPGERWSQAVRLTVERS